LKVLAFILKSEFPQGKPNVAISHARNSNNVKIVSPTASQEPILNDGEFQLGTFFIPILFIMSKVILS
jgi:hypothetical protein